MDGLRSRVYATSQRFRHCRFLAALQKYTDISSQLRASCPLTCDYHVWIDHVVTLAMLRLGRVRHPPERGPTLQGVDESVYHSIVIAVVQIHEPQECTMTCRIGNTMTC